MRGSETRVQEVEWPAEMRYCNPTLSGVSCAPARTHARRWSRRSPPCAADDKLLEPRRLLPHAHRFDIAKPRFDAPQAGEKQLVVRRVVLVAEPAHPLDADARERGQRVHERAQHP